jgi:hypothetical protein
MFKTIVDVKTHLEQDQENLGKYFLIRRDAETKLLTYWELPDVNTIEAANERWSEVDGDGASLALLHLPPVGSIEEEALEVSKHLISTDSFDRTRHEHAEMRLPLSVMNRLLKAHWNTDPGMILVVENPSEFATEEELLKIKPLFIGNYAEVTSRLRTHLEVQKDGKCGYNDFSFLHVPAIELISE